MGRLLPLALVLSACLAVACGGQEVERNAAVDARAGNEAVVGGVAYRVVLFRQLNPRAADDVLVESVETDAQHGLFAAFLYACNRTDEPLEPTSEIVLEDAFGDTYEPLSQGLERSLAYTPKRLEPDECIPGNGSGDGVFDGAALVFELPYDITQERPLILEIRQAGESARLTLDL